MKKLLLLSVFLWFSGTILAGEVEWNNLETEHFTIYYFTGNEAVARPVSDLMENEYSRITEQLGYISINKSAIIVSMEQTDKRNKVLLDSLGILNTPEKYKTYVEVVPVGDEISTQLREKLLFDWSLLMVNEMMYGGNMKQVFSGDQLKKLPDWFLRGAAMYAANGNKLEEIPQLDLANPGKINRLKGRDATVAGQSFWIFINDFYSLNIMPNLLNYARITRNEVKSTVITTGIPYDTVLNDWKNYYASNTE